MDQVNILEGHGSTYQLGPMFNITALQVLMTNFRDQFEHMAEVLPKNVPEEDKFDGLLKNILEFATKRRLEAAHRKRTDAMDIGGVEEVENEGE